MAIFVSAPCASQSLSGSALPRGSHSIAESGFGSSRNSQSVKGIGPRFAGLKSAFLGDSLVDTLRPQFGFRGANSISVQWWGSRAGCSGRSGRECYTARVSSIPFERGAAGRRHDGRSTIRGRAWSTGRIQEERIREILVNEIRARVKGNPRFEGQKPDEFYENISILLQVLEASLREEEEALVNASVKIQDERTVDGTEGPKTSSELSTGQLLKELRKRLIAELENRQDSHHNRQDSHHNRQDSHHNRQDDEKTREPARFRGRGRAGNVISLYEFLRNSDRGLREERVRLEELWKQRGGRRWGAKEETQESRRRERSVSPDSGIDPTETTPELDESEVASATEAEAEAEADAGTPRYPQSDGTVVYLKNETNGAEIYLVGTSHVSQKSADQVREVIQRVKPDVVMVELCRKRYEGLVRNSGKDRRTMFGLDRLVRMLIHGKDGTGGLGDLAGFFGILFRGFHPAEELRVAVEEGASMGAQIVLGDQDIDTTQERLGQFNLNLPFRGFYKHFWTEHNLADVLDVVKKQGFTDIYQALEDRKVVRRFNEEVEKGAPILYKVLVTERNQIMVKALRNLKGKVVAVVGLAHMDGMEQLWHQANENDIVAQSTQSKE